MESDRQVGSVQSRQTAAAGGAGGEEEIDSGAYDN